MRRRKIGIIWQSSWRKKDLGEKRRQIFTFKSATRPARISHDDGLAGQVAPIQAERHGHLFRFVHPWDVLVSKLQRLEEKDLEAFKLVIAKTGHPTEEEFTKHLQKAVDLYRPKFDEETARGDMMLNTRELWKILWNKEIDVRAAIIRPALERAQHDYEPPNSNLKTRLANLKLPPK